MAQPTLGVMALYLSNDRRLEELDFFKKLTLKGEKLGIDVMVFTPEDVISGGKRVNALRYDAKLKKWIRRPSPLPDIVYDRCRYQKSPRFQLLKKFRAEHPGLLFMNRPMALKWGVAKLLYRNRSIRPYLPVTTIYRQSSDLTRYLDRFNLVYLKPTDGTGGRGILRIERTSDDHFLIQGRDRHRRIISPQKATRDQLASKLSGWGLPGRYLVQQGIHCELSDGRVHDFRLLMQKNGSGRWEMTGCAGRIGAKRSITSNLHGGGIAVPMMRLLRTQFGSQARAEQIAGAMERLGGDVVETLEEQYRDLCEMALDIAVDKSGKVYLLEVNPKPAREVFYRIGEYDTYEKAIERPLQYALWLLGKKRPNAAPDIDDSWLT